MVVEDTSAPPKKKKAKKETAAAAKKAAAAAAAAAIVAAAASAVVVTAAAAAASSASASSSSRGSANGAPRGTLIVCPLSVLSNWSTQIESYLAEGAVSVYVYHGSDRERRPSVLQQYDIVITR